MPDTIYRFGGFSLDTARFELRGPDGLRPVEPQPLELLVYLIEHRDRLVTKGELHRAIWGARFVSDAALSTLVRAARRAVDDDGQAQGIIKTLHGRGFRFVAEVEVLTAAEKPENPPTATRVRQKPIVEIAPFGVVGADSHANLVAAALTEEVSSALAATGLFAITTAASAVAPPDHVLRGTLTRDDRRLRLHVRLCDAAGVETFRQRLDAEDADLFAVLDALVPRIARVMQPELLSAELRGGAGETRPRGWPAFVEALILLGHPSRDGNLRARDLLGIALATDAASAPYHAALSFTHLWDVLFDWTPDPRTSMGAAVEAASAALRCDPRDPWSLTAQGLCQTVVGDRWVAVNTLRTAAEGDPYSAFAHGALALALAFAGQSDDAIAAADVADALSPSDPRAALWHSARSIALLRLGDFDGALASGTKVTALYPDWPSGHRLVAVSAARLGRAEDARASVERLHALLPGVGARAQVAAIPYFYDPAEADSFAQALEAAGLPP